MLDGVGKFPEVPAMSAIRCSSHISESEKCMFSIAYFKREIETETQKILIQ